MANYQDDKTLFDEIFSDLTLSPNKYLVHNRINDYSDVPTYDGYFLESNRNGKRSLLLEVNGKKIERFQLTCDLGLFNASGIPLNHKILDFSIELFVVLKNREYLEDHAIMGIDELAFYVNMQRNEEIKELSDFPLLRACRLPRKGFNYISEGRRILNTYFPNLKGPAMNLYFEDELNEVFALASNSLAFLYKHKNRAIEEISIIKNERFYPQFCIYPRFNNCISETAGYIYSFWERVAFVINEFFPIKNNGSNKTPSFSQYFVKQNRMVDASLRSINFEWFVKRIGKEHKILSEMRHPMTHYNKFSNPAGMRSVDFIERQHNDLDENEQAKSWISELDFLTMEMTNLSESLEKMLLLIEEWAKAKNL